MRSRYRHDAVNVAKWLVARVRSSRGAAQWRTVKADPLAQPRWWGWVTIDPLMLAVLLGGFGRVIYSGWVAGAVVLAFMSLVFAFIVRGHRRAWNDRPPRFRLLAPQMVCAAFFFGLGLAYVFSDVLLAL